MEEATKDIIIELAVYFRCEADALAGTANVAAKLPQLIEAADGLELRCVRATIGKAIHELRRRAESLVERLAQHRRKAGAAIPDTASAGDVAAREQQRVC